MTANQLLSLLPLLILSGTAVLLTLAIAVGRSHRTAALLAFAGNLGTIISLPIIRLYLPSQVTPLLTMDRFAAYYLALLCAGCAVVVLLSYDFLDELSENREEYYLLLILATIGAGVLASSSHFASFFLGLEILSVSLYALIAYRRFEETNIEAGVKYLILAGVSSAILLFGMALIYTVTGGMGLSDLVAYTTSPAKSPLLVAGFGLLSVGVGFKLGVVPFHMWTPDVYQGAPSPVTGFIASVSKGGVLALLVRYFHQAGLYGDPSLLTVFTLIAIASMLLGNFMALLQTNLKRVLAYSSIAHLGYLLVPVVAGVPLTQVSVAFYLAVYFTTTLCAFGVITFLAHGGEESALLEDYRGLFWRHPWSALFLSVSLLSLAGLPPTGGLVGKIYLIAAGVDASLWATLLVLVAASVVGVFYYMRIVISLFRDPPEGAKLSLPLKPLFGLQALVLSALSLVQIGLGLYPTPVLQAIEKLVKGLP